MNGVGVDSMRDEDLQIEFSAQVRALVQRAGSTGPVGVGRLRDALATPRHAAPRPVGLVKARQAWKQRFFEAINAFDRGQLTGGGM